ncbi:MAG: hypothetical protein U5K71_05620 [Gracilimonas sp.]|nr:hypothetical protein [Gracilimonas sp.]
MFHRLLTVVILFSATTSLLAQSPKGSFRDTTPEDFVAKNLPSKYYNELWTYHADLNNGIQLVITFSINDFGSSFKERVTGGKLMVAWKDGQNYVVNKEYSPSDLISEAEDYYLRLHPERNYWAKGSLDDEHRLYYKTEKNGVKYDVDITFYDIAQGKAHGDGVYTIGSHQLGLTIPIPHASVKGYVAINDDTVQVNGTGYMDHLYQDNLTTDLIDTSYRVKQGDDTNGFYFHFLKIKSGRSRSTIGYGVGYKNGMAHLLSPSGIEVKQSRDNLDSKVVYGTYQDGNLSVTVENLLNEYSLINELGSVQKFFVKKVVGGELLEMHGTANINRDKDGYFYYMVAK